MDSTWKIKLRGQIQERGSDIFALAISPKSRYQPRADHSQWQSEDETLTDFQVAAV
jgi:hypothetical protein